MIFRARRPSKSTVDTSLIRAHERRSSRQRFLHAFEGNDLESGTNAMLSTERERERGLLNNYERAIACSQHFSESEITNQN